MDRLTLFAWLISFFSDWISIFIVVL